MKRSKFLASLAALAAAPFVRIDQASEPVITDPQPPTRITKFTNAIQTFREKYQVSDMDAKAVLEIYHQTGTLVWTKGPGSPVEWRPIQIIERHGKV